MLIKTGRFGTVTISEEDKIAFPEGLLGFNQLKTFVLLDDPDDEIFAWLQSCDQPDIAFPVLEPELFADDYKVNLSKNELELLQIKNTERIRSFSIITIPEDPTLMTANLKAPVILNVDKRIARQCVLQDNDLAIREPIFLKLQQKLVHSMPIRSQAVDLGIAIRVGDTAKTPEVQK
ncbi:MAG: flagellar assembly protein FliW [Bdellovibrionales bacterium]